MEYRVKKLGVEVVYSLIGHPQSNPTQKIMRKIGRLFITYCEGKHTSWPLYISKIIYYSTLATHYSTGCLPNKLHYGTAILKKILKFSKFQAFKLLGYKKFLLPLPKKPRKKIVPITVEIQVIRQDDRILALFKGHRKSREI